MFGKKLKDFVSGIDQFLAEYNKTHAKSASQIAEIQKAKRITRLRDNPSAEKNNNNAG